MIVSAVSFCLLNSYAVNQCTHVVIVIEASSGHVNSGVAIQMTNAKLIPLQPRIIVLQIKRNRRTRLQSNARLYIHGSKALRHPVHRRDTAKYNHIFSSTITILLAVRSVNALRYTGCALETGVVAMALAHL